MENSRFGTNFSVLGTWGVYLPQSTCCFTARVTLLQRLLPRSVKQQLSVEWKLRRSVWSWATLLIVSATHLVKVTKGDSLAFHVRETNLVRESREVFLLKRLQRRPPTVLAALQVKRPLPASGAETSEPNQDHSTEQTKSSGAKTTRSTTVN